MPSSLSAAIAPLCSAGSVAAFARRPAASRGTRSAPLDLAGDALAAERLARRRPAAPATLSAAALARIASASGWLDPVSSAAASRSTSASLTAEGDDVGDLGLALGQRAGLVEGDRGDLAEAFQHRAALHQQAAPGAGRERGGDRRRRRDDQRAGAADQQDREALVDPLVPGAAEEQRRHDGDQRRRPATTPGV